MGMTTLIGCNSRDGLEQHTDISAYAVHTNSVEVKTPYMVQMVKFTMRWPRTLRKNAWNSPGQTWDRAYRTLRRHLSTAIIEPPGFKLK